MSSRSSQKLNGHTLTALLVAHSDPIIHGQAVAAKALIEEAAGWSNVNLIHVNAVFAEERNALTSFRIDKVLRLFRYLFMSVRLVRQTSASVVIITPAFFTGPFLKDAFMILALRAFTNAHVVGWVHMDPFRLNLEKRPKWYRRLAAEVFQRVDCWVACAPALLNGWPAFISVERRHALTNGIEAPPPPKRLATCDRLRVAYLSVMDIEKGWKDLLEAAQFLCARRSDIEFHFYGNAAGQADADELRALFEQLPEADRIHWHGPAWGENKWRALADADLYCFPSHTEQFPIAVLEAMASGLPVIATRVGAIEDAVITGQGGWLVDVYSPGQIAEALEDALSDPSRLAAFGQFNRRRYESLFTRDKFGRRWEAFLAGFDQRG